jgi:hypothetical protein
MVSPISDRMECLGIHLLLIHAHLGFYFTLNGLCPGLVGIQPEDESVSKGFKPLAIGLYLSSHPFFVGFRFLPLGF